MRIGIALAGVLSALVFTPAIAQKKPNNPATTTITGAISVDASCDLLGTVVYVPGRAFLARLGISTDFTATGRPVSTFRIDNVPISLNSINIEVPQADYPVISATFTATTSITEVNITYPGDCSDALPRACSADSQCNDGNACTNDTCGANNRCTNTARTCNDDNFDTRDTCNPASGCVFTPNVCGDGMVVGAESCDDGNTISGDGCSATCQLESGFSCFGEPSVCVPGCASLPDGTECGGDGARGVCSDGVCVLFP